MAKGKKRLFTTVAVAALLDSELTGLDLRLYGWVSLHDGMSLLKGTGPGCYASNLTLFDEAKCDYAAGCRSLSKLVNRGLLVREKVGRSTRYRVTFPEPDTLPIGNLSQPEHVAASQSKPPEYVTEARAQPTESSSKTFRDYSSLSEELDSVETGKLDSVKTAHQEFDASEFLPGNTGRSREKDLAEEGFGRVSIKRQLTRHFPNLTPEAQLVRFEEEFQKIGRNADALALEERLGWAQWLSEMWVGYSGLQAGYHAERLHEELAVY